MRLYISKGSREGEQVAGGDKITVDGIEFTISDWQERPMPRIYCNSRYGYSGYSPQELNLRVETDPRLSRRIAAGHQ